MRGLQRLERAGRVCSGVGPSSAAADAASEACGLSRVLSFRPQATARAREFALRLGLASLRSEGSRPPRASSAAARLGGRGLRRPC